jgi:iron complex outermembrane recepter protein
MSRKYALYAAGLMACSALSTPVFAQDQEEADARSARDDNVIIVTATRRAQDVQDIPIAVTAVSQEQLDKQNVFNIQQVSQVATSFTATNAQVASGSVVLRVRGIGTTSNNIGFESAVGIFIDGVYQSRPGVALSEMVDLERVEVLRGPQGTLFGRNTSAGALNITTARPDVSEFGGFVNGMYGNFNHFNLQGAINAPIVQDKLAVRLTGAYRSRDGFLTIVDGDGDRIGETNTVDQFVVRGQLGWDLDNGMRGRIIGDYSESRNSCCGAAELYQSPQSRAGFQALGLAPNAGNGQPFVATSRFDQAGFERVTNNRVISANFAPTALIKNYGITADLEFPVTDSSDLIIVGGWRKFESREVYDSDFTALDIFNVDAELDLETYTLEVRYQGEAFGGRLNYMIGGFYSDEQIDQNLNFALGRDFDLNFGALLGGALGPAPLGFVTGGLNPANVTNNNRFRQSAQSYALFTHNTFEITDGLEFTAGARYAWERKQGDFTQPANNNPVCPAVLNQLGFIGGLNPALVPAFVGVGCFGFAAPADLPQAAGLPLPRTFDVDFRDEELIWTVNLNYAVTPNVNVYAGFTHGFKAGGINLDTTAAVGGNDPVFQSEIVDSYEIGLKSRFLDDAVTLNIAAFHMDITNFQVLEFTGAAFETFNVPRAKTTGVEIESLIRPNRELTFNLGLTALNARYPDNCAGDNMTTTVNALCGFTLTNAPQLIAIFGATWEKEISRSTDFFINGQVRLESDQRTSTQAINNLAVGSVADLPNAPRMVADIQDGKAFVNMRGGFRFADGKYAIEGWVTNLTNEVVRGVTFNTVLRGSAASDTSSRSAFLLPPREYGVTLRARF